MTSRATPRRTDQNVQSRPALQNRGDRLLDRGWIGEVVHEDHCFTTARLDARCDIFGGRTVGVITDCHASTFVRKTASDGRADATRSAGDDGDALAETQVHE